MTAERPDKPKLTYWQRQLLAQVALSHAADCECETVCKPLKEAR